MAPQVQLSVVLSTYNRAAMLPAALDCLLAQRGDVPYEIIVVDNNSTDTTASIACRYAAQHPERVRYLFEPQQGLSYGRNAGIGAARAPLVAFTDDDVEVAPDWVARLKSAFDAHPDATYVGGRILPRWTQPPPRWLTDAHWSPLALQDYGEVPLRSGPARPVCLVGANLAFRKSVFDRVGLFTPRFGRIKDGIGSTEDHDMQLRIWQAGLEGIYVPAVVAHAEVPSDRMQKAYHRRWHSGHGRHCARMRLREIVPEDFTPMGRPDNLVVLGGAPAFLYREVLLTARRWVEAVLWRRDPFFYANRLRYLTRYITESWKLRRRETGRSVLGEVLRFVVQYARKRTRTGGSRAAGSAA
jgi:glycosyltransferase involved in cell wall biosynthesis